MIAQSIRGEADQLRFPFWATGINTGYRYTRYFTTKPGINTIETTLTDQNICQFRTPRNLPVHSSWPDVLGVMAAKGIEGLKMKELKPVELPDDDNLPVARVWVEDGVFVPVGQDAPPKSGKEE